MQRLGTGSEQPAVTPGLVSPTVDRLRQVICALHGHDLLLHFEHDRLSLRCATCGWESPGWTIEGRFTAHHSSSSGQRFERQDRTPRLTNDVLRR